MASKRGTSRVDAQPGAPEFLPWTRHLASCPSPDRPQPLHGSTAGDARRRSASLVSASRPASLSAHVSGQPQLAHPAQPAIPVGQARKRVFPMGLDLVQRLAQHRAEEQRLAWSGTFAEYFDLVRENPQLARLAHARIYDMMVEAGVTTDEQGLHHYGFFADEIYGIEHALDQIVEYFNSAAQRLEVRKRILLLMGPVGGGKSTIVTMLKRGLEAWTRGDAGAVYAIKDCPMHEEPLHLIPAELRAEIEKHYGIYIEGDLCPQCRYALEHAYGGRHEDVRVHRIVFSEKQRVGIGTFAPSDPKCVTGDTILLTNRGMLRFDELQREVCARENEFVPFGVAVSGVRGAEWTSHFYNGGVRRTRRVRT